VPTRERPYVYYDAAISVCSTCYRKVEGKIVFQDDRVYMLKRCPAHGLERVLVADDVAYYRQSRETFLKRSEMPLRFGTGVRWGCPYDCGLCADHEQHSCISIVELCDHCNLRCPICYAASGPHRAGFRPLAQVERMLDAVVAAEGEPDVVQLSGGEPTTHPDFFAILDAARRRPIKHLMVNTNGLRIAAEPAFAERLAGYMPGLELYLQLDSLEAGPLIELRGADLRAVRRRAVDRLNALGLSTTLVVTLKKGLNDGEVGRIVDWALEQPCVRGVTFQPIQDAGRVEGFDPATDRLTLSEVRRALLAQSDVFRPEDVVPVPCHPDCLAMAYALKLDGRVVPLTGLIPLGTLVEAGRNTVVFEQEPAVREAVFDLLSAGNSPEGGATRLRDLLCCLPRVAVPEGLGYANLFRVLIVQFMDAHSLDVRSVRKSCVHIVHPEDGRMIPFDTYNLFYRDDLERTRLDPLRQIEAARLAVT
jgi:uncharacterized radical SAM superfamily Fe-S cluster-containing enzyme